MAGGICTGLEFAFHRCIRENLCIGNKQIHCINAEIQVIFDLVKIAIIGVRDFRRDITFRNTVNILSGYI